MEQVRTTGIYFIGECDLKLENCLAKSPAPITAVKLEQNGAQVNVCKSCLGKMLDSGVWQLKGARFVARHDYALISRDGNPLVALEVKRKPRVPTLNEAEWAQAFARNLAVHGMSTAPRLVLLAVLDGNLYAWKTTDLFRDLKPLVVVETNSALKDLGLAPPAKGLAEEFATSSFSAFLSELTTKGLSASLPWVRPLELEMLPLDGAVARSEYSLTA